MLNAFISIYFLWEKQLTLCCLHNGYCYQYLIIYISPDIFTNRTLVNSSFCQSLIDPMITTFLRTLTLSLTPQLQFIIIATHLKGVCHEIFDLQFFS